jgi:asparagine synthase (glutamine-hydrolysing)
LQSATSTHPSAVATGAPRFAGQPASADPASAWRAAFAAQGMRAPAAVGGDFAVAVDGTDGRRWLAVDRFAVRSLCFRRADGGLVVGERADTVAGPGAELDAQALFDYLHFHVIPSPRTVFAGVERLPAGHAAVFGAGGLESAPYWVARFEEPRAGDLPALKTSFLELLRTAVADQRDGGRTGCFLSGGTDSSTVAGMLTRVGGKPAPTFSIGFDAQGYDEMEYSRIAARHFGTEHHEYYVTPADLVRSIPAVAASFDQPFGNSSVLPAYYCAKLAAEHGVTRMLGGDGGDELFGGNSRYARQRIFEPYARLPRALRRGVLEPLLADQPFLGGLPLLRKGASYIRQARTPMPDRMHSANLLEALGLARVLEPGFLARVDAQAPLRARRAVYATCAADSELNRMLAYDWRFTLAEADLPKVVGATRLAGLPVGFPLLDERLVDFSLGLPPSFKVRGFKLRWFFKEALRDFLPRAIIEKRKQGFGLPFGVWLERDAALRALAEDSLGSLGTRGMVRPAFLRELMQERLHEHPGYFGEMVWILMMLEQWLRAHAPAARLA